MSAAAVKAGLRAATATVAPLVLAAALGQPLLIWAALGGWLTSLADAGGAFRTRARSMAAFVVGGAVTCAVASAVAPHRAASLVLLAVWAAAGGLLRVGGDVGAALGTMFAATFVAALAMPAADGREALARGALLAAGGLSAMALALVVWPVRPYAPVREAAAGAVRALAALARGLRDAWHAAERAPADAPDGPRTPFATLARTRHAPVRAALEEARVALAETRRRRLATSRAAEDLAVLLEQLDELFASVVAAEGAVEAAGAAADEPVRTAIGQLLRRLPEALDGLAGAVGEGRRSGSRPAALPALDAAVVALWAAAEPEESAHADSAPAGERVGHAAALLEQVATHLEAAADTAAAMIAGRDEPRAPRRPRAPLAALAAAPRALAGAVAAGARQLAGADDVTRRHALRLALVVTVAQLAGGALHVARGQWLTTTALLVLQPYAGATWQRSAARVGGTVLGGVLAALLAALVHDQLALAAAMFVLAVAAVAVRRADYALFTFFLTPIFVLLAEPALGDWRLAGVRVVDTLGGGVLAVAASRLLWPRYESRGIPATLGTLLDRVREVYASAARAAGLLPDDGGPTPARARRLMGLAANTADAALERWLAEPRVSGRDAEALLTVLAEVRRVGVACSGLAVLPPAPGAPPAPLAERARALDALLAELAAAARVGRVPAAADPSIVAGAAGAMSRRTAEHHVVAAAAGPLARVARHALGLHGAVTRLAAADAGARDAA